MRVLVVEDDQVTRGFLKEGLELAYYVVDVAADGEQGSYLARTNEYDVVILDNRLPKKAGADVCHDIRASGKTTPIIILSVISDTDIKTELLDTCADDYMTKPFALKELQAHLRAVLRRHPPHQARALPGDRPPLSGACALSALALASRRPRRTVLHASLHGCGPGPHLGQTPSQAALILAPSMHDRNGPVVHPREPSQQGDTMTGAQLLTHRGTIRVMRDDLSQFDPPPGTRTWTPVKHSELVESLHNEIATRGLQVKQEEYAVQRQGNVLFGTLDLDWQNTGEYAAAIGLRTANDKSMSIQLAVGLRVLVCDNLCFAGDLIALKRKHTARLDLSRELAGALDRYQAGVIELQGGVARLKDTPVTVEAAKSLVYDVFQRRIVPIRLFRPVAQTLYATLRQHGLNRWWVNNAFTTHIKSLPPAPAFRAHVRLGQFFSLT